MELGKFRLFMKELKSSKRADILGRSNKDSSEFFCLNFGIIWNIVKVTFTLTQWEFLEAFCIMNFVRYLLATVKISAGLAGESDIVTTSKTLPGIWTLEFDIKIPRMLRWSKMLSVVQSWTQKGWAESLVWGSKGFFQIFYPSSWNLCWAFS